MKMRRLISVLLLICLVVTLLPAGAVKVNAASLEPDEYGQIIFTSFEELKTLCSRKYSEDAYTYAWYQGDEELVIKENLTIPDYLDVYAFMATIKVPKGVTLTVNEWSYLSTSNLTVEGTVNVSDLSIDGLLTLTGKMSVSKCISLPHELSHKGIDKITFAKHAFLSWECYFENNAQLAALVEKATVNQEVNSNWKYSAHMGDADVVIKESLTLPANLYLSAYPYSGKVYTLTLAKGFTLTNEGGMTVQIPFKVEGTLVNNSSIYIFKEETDFNGSGELTVTSTGKYTGTGMIGVGSSTLTDPQKAIKGLDLNEFDVKEYVDDYYRSWEFYPKGSQQPGQPSQPSGTITRLAGNTRYATAIAAAEQLKNLYGVDKFETIIVSSGEDFADALAGSYLAAVKGAPILLVKDSTVKMVKEYIQQNLVPGGTVYLLGGKAAVPEKMETGLDGFNVKRLGGNTRYDTNLLILQEAGVAGKNIIVCTGKSFADSLSASAVGLPILLVKDGLTTAQKDFLKEANANYFIIGGKNAVTETVEKQLKGYGETHRIAGDTRYKTSVMVAQFFAGSNQHAVLAYGDNFPDGLAGGPLAYALGAPLLLTKPGREADAADFIASRGISSGYVMGGTAVLPDKTVNKIFGIN